MCSTGGAWYNYIVHYATRAINIYPFSRGCDIVINTAQMAAFSTAPQNRVAHSSQRAAASWQVHSACLATPSAARFAPRAAPLCALAAPGSATAQLCCSEASPSRSAPASQPNTSASSSVNNSNTTTPAFASQTLRLCAALCTALVASAAADPGPCLAAASSAPKEALQPCELWQAAEGVQYCDLRIGEGLTPAAGAFIKANYIGQLAGSGAHMGCLLVLRACFLWAARLSVVQRAWDKQRAGALS